MCDQMYLYVANSSKKQENESTGSSESSREFDKTNILTNDNSEQFETSCIIPDNNHKYEKQQTHLYAADSSEKRENEPTDISENNQAFNKSNILTFDKSKPFETSSSCITPNNNNHEYLYAADSSKKLENEPSFTSKNSELFEKSNICTNDMKPFETSSCIMPDNNHGFDKPRLFAADSSKKLESPLLLSQLLPENLCKKRRSISVKEKLEILNMVDNGHKITAVARKFGISSSTASTIVKERQKIKLLSNHYNIDPDRKRMRLGIYRDVDEAVHVWFRQMKRKNIPINGPMLQQKAREFAVQLGHQNFEGSSGWLFRFRERHGLTVKTMRDSDESNFYNCPGVGMTDDEIVATVSQNQFNPLNFFESGKDKISSKSNKKNKVNNCNNNNNTSVMKSEIPENYFVPEIELTDYEPTVTLSEAVSLSEKLTSFLKDHDAPSNILESINAVNYFLDKDLREQMKQRKITDYFKIQQI